MRVTNVSSGRIACVSMGGVPPCQNNYGGKCMERQTRQNSTTAGTRAFLTSIRVFIYVFQNVYLYKRSLLYVFGNVYRYKRSLLYFFRNVYINVHFSKRVMRTFS